MKVVTKDNRTESLDHKTLSFVGRFSLRLSNNIVIKNLIEGSWLDLLCGYNSQLQVSQQNNYLINNFVSLDLKLNKELRKTKIECLEKSIDKNLPFDSNLFDNITVVNGLEHLWHPQEILKDCHRVLKKRGILQVIVPTWFGKPILEFIGFKLNNSTAYTEMNDHKMYYEEKSLWPMLINAGFKPSDIKLKRIKFYFSLYAKAIKN